MDGTHRIEIDDELAGERLDRALTPRFPEESRTSLAAWIQQGCVTVNGKSVRPSYRLRTRDEVVVRPPARRGASDHIQGEDLPLQLLYEDEHLVVIDKPTGLTVHPGSGQPGGTLANALVYHFEDLPESGGSDRPGIVHRLDKDTSGVIVVAKSDASHRRLSEAFAERRVKKTYLACVHGNPDDDEGEIDLPIGRSTKDRKKMAVRADQGREATTFWAVERRLPRHALLRLAPRTGRTHQIRVHLKSIRHPIVGDPIYGNRGLPGNELAPRLLLHAWRLAFEHPMTGKPCRYEAPLPADFEAALGALAALSPPRR